MTINLFYKMDLGLIILEKIELGVVQLTIATKALFTFKPVDFLAQ